MKIRLELKHDSYNSYHDDKFIEFKIFEDTNVFITLEERTVAVKREELKKLVSFL